MEVWTRSIVEVLKLSESKETVREFRRVNRKWNTAAKHQDLWWTYIAEWTGSHPSMEGDTESGGWYSYYLYCLYTKSLFCFHSDYTLPHPQFPPLSQLEIISLPSFHSSFHSFPPSYTHPFNSSYLYLPVASLFISGGRTPSSDRSLSPSHLYSLVQDKVNFLGWVPRVDYPLLVHCGDFIWSFGLGSLTSNVLFEDNPSHVRSFSLRNHTWIEPVTNIDLPSRHYQGHGESYKDSIYLFGGKQSKRLIDVFDTVKLTFRTLDVKIPFSGSVLIGCKQGDSLYLFSKSAGIRYNFPDLILEKHAETDLQLQLSTSILKSSPGVLISEHIYVLLYETVVLKVNINTGDCWTWQEGEW